MFPCCITCENCGRHINFESLEAHRTHCTYKLPEPIMDPAQIHSTLNNPEFREHPIQPYVTELQAEPIDYQHAFLSLAVKVTELTTLLDNTYFTKNTNDRIQSLSCEIKTIIGNVCYPPKFIIHGAKSIEEAEAIMNKFDNSDPGTR